MRHLLFLVFLLLGCAHSPPPLADRVFPLGTYHHHVTVRVHGDESIELQGAVQIEPESWRLSALSSAGTTLFRLTESQGRTNVENFHEGISSDRIHTLNRWVKKFMTADRRQNVFSYDGAEFSLNELDERKIPRAVHIRHPRMEIMVKVLAYRLL